MKILIVTLSIVLGACGQLPDPAEKIPDRPFEKIPTFPELKYNTELAVLLATYINELKNRGVETYYKDLVQLELLDDIQIAGFRGETAIQGSCTVATNPKTGDVEKRIVITKGSILSVFHLFGECLGGLTHSDDEISFMNQELIVTPEYLLENRTQLFDDLADKINNKQE